MSALAELRGAIDQEWHNANAVASPVVRGLSIALDLLDVFEAAHPGLVDETVTYECGKCGRTIVTTGDEDAERAFNRYCPACAKVTP